MQNRRTKASDAHRDRVRMIAAIALAAVTLGAFTIPRAMSGDTAAAVPARPISAPAKERTAEPPKPEPLLLAPVAPATAAAINAATPLAGVPSPAAASYVIRARTPADQFRSQDCLAQAVYYEARSEGEEGQRAVAQVVLNRLRHPAYPASVCGVVYQGSERPSGCQFTFTCDGSLALPPRGRGWERARRIAAEALAGKVYAPVGHATHYHTNQVLPYWASRLMKSAVVGAHIFYRWGGGWGEPAAFRQRYAGVEPIPALRPLMPAADPAVMLAAKLASAAKIAGTSSTDTLPQVKYTDAGLPQSTVREAYRKSGSWRVDPDKLGAVAAPAQ